MPTLLDLGGLSKKQADSIRQAKVRVNVWEGSIRSGKTVASLLSWLLYVAVAPRGGELVIIGRTRDSIWRNVVAPLQDESISGPAAQFVIGNYGAPTVSILGRRVFIIGASDAKAEKVIRGLTVAGAYVDEITTLLEEFFTQLLGRMSVTGARLFGTTNPDNPAHWLKAKFLDRIKELPDWRSWHFGIDDNPGLADEYKDSIRREFTGLWYRRFILGEWVAAEGAIYETWNPDVHVVDRLPDMRKVISLGIDYGVTNATAGVLVGLGADHRLYALDEWRRERRQNASGLTISEVSSDLQGWIGEHDQPPEYVCVDPSAAELKLQLHRDRVPGVMDADNDVIYGIRILASLMASDRLRIHKDCAGLITEIPGYSWDPKATLRGEDKPIKVADHSLDGWRYAITSTETIWRPWTDQPLPETAAAA